jgi:hypothetical protein
VYVLKAGLCAEFTIVSPPLDFAKLDEFLKDDLRTEARFGFIRIQDIRRWTGSPQASQALLQHVLQIPDQAELARRLALGMHRLTAEEFKAIVEEVRSGR